MTGNPRRLALPPALVACALLVAAAIALRPITPVDETRYLTVAWEMRLSGDWVSLTLNGALYGHKPPLLFWLVNLGWSAFGVNEWWPRLMTGLFAAAALALAASLARALAPQRDDVVAMTVWITASALFWMGFTGAVMFDTMLAFFVLLGLRAVVWAAAGGGWRAWCLAGLALGLGTLTKGPVALLHVLPAALLAPAWRDRLPGSPRGGHAAWYGGLAVAVVLGAAIALAWAVPSALAGGAAFGREIFVSQSIDRIATTTHHLRPFWWYLPMLPLLMLPWLFFPAVWRGLAALALGAPAPGVRFVLAWSLPVLIAFSAFRGKQVQYLLPEILAFAFLAASALASLRGGVRRWEAWTVALLLAAMATLLMALTRHPRVMHLVEAGERATVGWSAGALVLGALLVAVASRREAWHAAAAIAAAAVLAVLGIYAGFGRAAFDNFDLHPTAQRLALAQQAGQPVAHSGKYHGQFQFLGRLERPLEVVNGREPLLEWAAAHPDGWVVLTSRAALVHAGGAHPELVQKFRGRWISVWRAPDLPGVSDGWYRDGGNTTDDE